MKAIDERKMKEMAEYCMETGKNLQKTAKFAHNRAILSRFPHSSLQKIPHAKAGKYHR